MLKAYMTRACLDLIIGIGLLIVAMFMGHTLMEWLDSLFTVLEAL